MSAGARIQRRGVGRNASATFRHVLSGKLLGCETLGERRIIVMTSIDSIE